MQSGNIQRLSTTPFEAAIHLEQKKWKPEYTKLPDANTGSSKIKLKRLDDNFIRKAPSSGTHKKSGRDSYAWMSDKRIRGQLIRTGICAAVLLVVIGISSIDIPFAKDVTRGLKTALTFDVNVDRTLGKLKFVQEAFPDIREVFSSDAAERFAVIPVDGKIINKYGDNEFEGIKIKTSAYSDVRCPADGVVESISIGDETAFVINHGEYTSIITFKGAAVSMQNGTNVAQNEAIGMVAANSEIVFEMQHKGAPVDPESCIMEADDKAAPTNGEAAK